jgi:Family of unknown function (DUF6535)
MMVRQEMAVYLNVTPNEFDTGHESSWQGMWTTYMKTFEEYDKRITNAWKEDTNGLLTFVSHNLQITTFAAMNNR